MIPIGTVPSTFGVDEFGVKESLIRPNGGLDFGGKVLGGKLKLRVCLHRTTFSRRQTLASPSKLLVTAPTLGLKQIGAKLWKAVHAWRPIGKEQMRRLVNLLGFWIQGWVGAL